MVQFMDIVAEGVLNGRRFALRVTDGLLLVAKPESIGILSLLVIFVGNDLQFKSEVNISMIVGLLDVRRETISESG